MRNKLFNVKHDLAPLYREGDSFEIVKRNEDPDLMPIEARKLRGGQVYGFEERELE